MKINGTDIGKFGARLLSIDIQPPKEGARAEWLAGGLLPHVWAGEQTLGSAVLQFYMLGPDPGEILTEIGRLLEQAQGEMLLQELPGYMGEYVGFMTGNDIRKVLRSRRRRIFTLEFEGYLRGQTERCSFSGVTEGIIRRKGNRKVPVVLTVNAREHLEQLEIRGLGTSIVVRELEADTWLRIDGSTGDILLEGENFAPNVEMWEVPVLEHPTTQLFLSSDRVTVNVEYRPILL